MSRPVFADRVDAGRGLAAVLADQVAPELGQRALALGLPRGGVPVAAEVARTLGLPLDVILVRKLGVPGHEELAMGAIGEDGVRVLNDDVVRHAGVTEAVLERVERRERTELERRARVYRGAAPRRDLTGRTVIVVDDGVATGATARAACAVARAHGAARIVLATPVAPLGWEHDVAGAADRFVAVHTPVGFGGVGQYYADFRQTSDAEVVATLAEQRRRVR